MVDDLVKASQMDHTFSKFNPLIFGLQDFSLLTSNHTPNSVHELDVRIFSTRFDSFKHNYLSFQYKLPLLFYLYWIFHKKDNLYFISEYQNSCFAYLRLHTCYLKLDLKNHLNSFYLMIFLNCLLVLLKLFEFFQPNSIPL